MGAVCPHPGKLKASPQGKRCASCGTLIYLPATSGPAEHDEREGAVNHHRTGRAARDWVIDHREEVIQRYERGRPASRLAQDYAVSATWLTDRLKEWGVQLRGRAEASALRGPGVNPYEAG